MLLSVHLGNFSPVDLDACSLRNKTKMVEHKLVSFATIVRLCRLFQLYYYLCSGKTYQTKIMPFLPLCCDSEAVLSKNSPKLECSYWKIFIPNTEISAARRDIRNRTSSNDRADVKRPSSSNTCESESGKSREDAIKARLE